MFAIIKKAHDKKKKRAKEADFTKVAAERASKFVKHIANLGSDVDFSKAVYFPHQNAIRNAYDTEFTQIFVAVLIFLNFLVSVVQAQTLSTADFFYHMEVLFTVLFAIELTFNMYGHWFLEFWNSSWNIFDFIIVGISVLSISYNGDLPAIGVLRLFRAFRAFRLFRRVENLRKIIEGIIRSMPSVANAFVILVLVMSIWSIMGVQLFGEYHSYYFGNFALAMFTLLQVLTMDSWASNIARSVIDTCFSENECGLYAVIYFVSYILTAGIIMMNVVIAVLLEKFLDFEEPSEEKKDEYWLEEEPRESFSVEEDLNKNNSKRVHFDETNQKMQVKPAQLSLVAIDTELANNDEIQDNINCSNFGMSTSKIISLEQIPFGSNYNTKSKSRISKLPSPSMNPAHKKLLVPIMKQLKLMNTSIEKLHSRLTQIEEKLEI